MRKCKRMGPERKSEISALLAGVLTRVFGVLDSGFVLLSVGVDRVAGGILLYVGFLAGKT